MTGTQEDNLMQTAATDTIARNLIPLVHEVAAQVARRVPSHVGMDDLVGAGMLGLAGALTRYDEERSDTFKGYAEFRIRGAIIDDLRRRDIMSRDARIESKRLQKSIDDLSHRLGHQAEADEIAEHLGVTMDEYREMQLRLNGARLVSSEDLDLSDDADSPLQCLEETELRRRLIEGIEALPERLRLVLWLYYYEELPLRAIADMLNVTPSRICQIRSEAVNRLREEVHGQEQVAAAA